MQKYVYACTYHLSATLWHTLTPVTAECSSTIWAQGAQVVWVNKNGELHQPYDFILTDGQGRTYLVDVKTTTTNKTAFHISASELKQAMACATTADRQYDLLLITNFETLAQDCIRLEFSSAVSRFQLKHIKFWVLLAASDNPVRVENGALILPFPVSAPSTSHLA